MQYSQLNTARFETRGLLLLAMVLACICWAGLSHAQTTVVWSEDWEGSWTDNWHADQAVWEAGVPKSGPNTPHSGLKCAATVLNGNYPDYADTRMIRHTTFVVPDASENPRLRFWHWYNFSSNDYGKVQIKVGNGSWGDISTSYSGYCSVWTYPLINLATYAGKTVSIAFFFHSSDDGWSGSDVGPGWYIDDIAVLTGPMTFNNPESWEAGLGDWSPERGTWEVGPCKAGVGPEKAYSGQNCAATVLSGNYTDWVDSRLISFC